jgi:Protein of unknown function (DUF3761).
MTSREKLDAWSIRLGVAWIICAFVFLVVTYLRLRDEVTLIAVISVVIGSGIATAAGACIVLYPAVIVCAFRPLAVVAGIAALVTAGVALYNSQNIPSTYTWKECVGAVCSDGWVSSSTGSGTCSHHGGVREWLYRQRQRALTQPEICQWETTYIQWPGFWSFTLVEAAIIGSTLRKLWCLEQSCS